MLDRRHILLGFGSALLAGCATDTTVEKRPSNEPKYGNGVVKFGPSAATDQAASTQAGVIRTAPGLRVVEVSVDSSGINGLEGGRQISIPPARIQSDLRAVLLATLKSDSEGGRPVKVNLLIESFALVSPGQSALIGGVSTIAGTMWVVDAVTGAAVRKPEPVRGTAKGGWAPGGLIGAALTKSPEEDYRATLAGFSGDVKKRLFGKQT